MQLKSLKTKTIEKKPTEITTTKAAAAALSAKKE